MAVALEKLFLSFQATAKLQLLHSYLPSLWWARCRSDLGREVPGGVYLPTSCPETPKDVRVKLDGCVPVPQKTYSSE